MKNEKNYGKLKMVVSVAFVFITIIAFAYGLATQQFNTITLLSSEIGTGGAVGPIESGNVLSGENNIFTGNTEIKIQKQDGISKSEHSVKKELPKPIKVRPELVEDVDCSKINLPNKNADIKAKYACSLHPNSIMLSSFHQEAGWNEWAIGLLGEEGVCQLFPNKTNKVFINDPRWHERWFQIMICVSKWKAVPNQKQIRASYSSNAYKKYLHYYK